jgi:type I restriction enzyme S subunit
VGAVQQHFNVGSARELRIPNLTLFEQRCIASVLCAIDDKIEANEQSLRIVDQLLRTQFQILAAAALAHVSDGDPLPRGWRHTNLASVLDVLETGSRPKGGVSAYSSGVPSLGAESVLGLARYNYSKTKYVPIEFFDKMRRGISQDLDVLLYKDGGRPGEFEPHVALLGQGFPFAMFCTNEHVYRLRGTEGVSQEFLYCWLSSEPILEEMRRRGTGVAIPGLNSSAVKGLPIELPSTEEIERFTKVARPLVSFALKSALESQALAAMRDGLLPGLLSGVIRVREEELNLGGVV